MTNSENNFMSVISKMAEAHMEHSSEDFHDLYEEVPVINVRRSVQIVYSKDSPKSIKAASTIKSLIESIEKGSVADSVYGFKVTEIGDLLIKDVADVYIWIDLPKTNVSENPIIIDKFNEAEHHSVIGNGAGPWVRSYFGERIEDFVASGGYATRYVDDSSEPLVGLQAERTVHVGVILNSICAISYAVPELVIPETEMLIEYLSYMENLTTVFYSKQAKTSDILKEFTAIHNGLVNLTGQGQTLSLNNQDMHLMQRIAEGCSVAIAYNTIYKRVREQLVDQGMTGAVGVNPAYKHQVAYVRIQDHIWMVRRIVAMSNLSMRNTRIAAYGTHTTTVGLKTEYQNDQRVNAIQSVA